MKLNIQGRLFLWLISCFFSTSAYSDSGFSTYEIKKLLRHKIAIIYELAANPMLIEEVKQRNELNIPLTYIKNIDSQWKSYPDDHHIKTSMYSSPAGAYLKARVDARDSIFSEIFLTDGQGANITAWPITTDYWQGDEAKWGRSFNNGKGDIHIGNLEFDESSQKNAIQVSVPIIDEGRAIGVLIAGIKITYIQAKYLNSKYKTD